MKVTDRGSAKPDDPIFKTGLIVGGKRIEPSSKPKAKKPKAKKKA